MSALKNKVAVVTGANSIRIGWILSLLAALALAASAIDKISSSAHALEMSTLFGISPLVYQLLGAIELLSVVLFLIPRTGVLGLLLLSSYMGGAIATHLLHSQSLLFPAAFESVIWIAACLRFSELTQRLVYNKEAGNQ